MRGNRQRLISNGFPILPWVSELFLVLIDMRRIALLLTLLGANALAAQEADVFSTKGFQANLFRIAWPG